jgi:hypothetical protein
MLVAVVEPDGRGGDGTRQVAGVGQCPRPAVNEARFDEAEAVGKVSERGCLGGLRIGEEAGDEPCGVGGNGLAALLGVFDESPTGSEPWPGGLRVEIALGTCHGHGQRMRPGIGRAGAVGAAVRTGVKRRLAGGENGQPIALTSGPMPPRTIEEFEEGPRARLYLDRYTDPSRYYAFATYDQAPIHTGPLSAADVLMANLLSLRLRWHDVSPLFASGSTQRFAPLRIALDDALAEARRLPLLEDCTEEQAAMPALRWANETAKEVGPYQPGKPRAWTIVSVSKVLHRLSPNIPLVDSKVLQFYATTYAGRVRSRMREDLARNRDWMEPIAADYPVRGQPLPLTRMADILIWMDARSTAGHPL